MHERAPRGRFCLSEYAPNHAWRTKGGISGKSHIRKWAICRKNENFTVWKCARMHERAPRGRFLLSEYAPNHAWHTKGGINGKSLRFTKNLMDLDCRVTRRSGENLGPKRSLICSIGDVFGLFPKCPGYLARARARAPGPRVALGPPALLTIGDYDQRLFARAQLSKNLLVFWAILSRGSFFYFCVNFILFCLNCVQMFYNLFNISRVFNLTLCVSAGKITQSWKKTRARAPLFKLKILVRSPGVV